MRCEKCGYENLETNNYCISCGEPLNKIKEEVVTPEVVSSNKKKSKAPIVIICIVGGVLLLVVLILFILSYFKGDKFVVGEYRCISYPSSLGDYNSNELMENFYSDDAIIYKFNADGTFTTNMGTDGLVKGTYEIKEKSKKTLGEERIILMTSNYRKLDGVEYTDPYTTEFSLVRDNTNRKEYVMMNVVTYNMYACLKK